MIEDKLLIWKFKRGSKEALRRIYEKYVTYLVTLAAALLNDVHGAEDVVHDFFVWFAQSADKLKLQGSLKGFLATCVANRARDKIRARKQRTVQTDMAESISSDIRGPEVSAICAEELRAISEVLNRLPYEQREVILLHLQGGMMFTQIAKAQNVSVNTIRSRYRYGMNKLRALLEAEMTK